MLNEIPAKLSQTYDFDFTRACDIFGSFSKQTKVLFIIQDVFKALLIILIRF